MGLRVRVSARLTLTLTLSLPPNLCDVRVIEDPLYEALDAPSAAQGHL